MGHSFYLENLQMLGSLLYLRVKGIHIKGWIIPMGKIYRSQKYDVPI